MPTDTFRLQVVKALCAALDEITVANGYQHDLAGRVYRGRAVLTEEDGLPALAVNEPPQAPDLTPIPRGGAVVESKLVLLIQGFVQDDRDHPTDPAYRMLGDVQKRLAQERLRSRGFDILGFGSRVMSLDLGQGVVRPPDELVSDTAFFWLPVTLTFGENLHDPFA